jgi:hypothetical protein
MNLVVSRTLLTLIFSSDTPIEDSSFSAEYENKKNIRVSYLSLIVGPSVACLSNIDASSTTHSYD